MIARTCLLAPGLLVVAYACGEVVNRSTDTRGLFTSSAAFVAGLAGVLFPDLFDFGGLGERGVTRMLSAAMLFVGSVMLASFHYGF